MHFAVKCHQNALFILSLTRKLLLSFGASGKIKYKSFLVSHFWSVQLCCTKFIQLQAAVIRFARTPFMICGHNRLSDAKYNSFCLRKSWLIIILCITAAFVLSVASPGVCCPSTLLLAGTFKNTSPVVRLWHLVEGLTASERFMSEWRAVVFFFFLFLLLLFEGRCSSLNLFATALFLKACCVIPIDFVHLWCVGTAVHSGSDASDCTKHSRWILMNIIDFLPRASFALEKNTKVLPV